jgi:type VI secretion system protein ImpH
VATEGRRRDPDLTTGLTPGALAQSPYTYEFFQAVRLLSALTPSASPPGEFSIPAGECVRFSAAQSLAFPASQIQSIEFRGQGPPVMTVNFMGLTGPQGVLPLMYSALVRERLRERDPAMRDFFDIFNHRIISLFYQAWEKYRFGGAATRDRREPLTQILLDLIGFGTSRLQRRQAVADESCVFYSGLIAQRPRSASALKQILEDYFGVPVAIIQFAGFWYPLSREDQCLLSDGPAAANSLGAGAVVGDEVWYQQSRVRLRLGPLKLKQYLDFLPGGSAHEPLRAFTALFAAQELDFEAQLVLDRRETPLCVLGEDGPGAARLGWLTWARTAAMERDPADTVLRL